jgi:CHAT domain-containing protein
VRESVRVLLIGDPNQGEGIGLPGALKEVNEIANIYSEHQGIICDLLIGPEASYFNVAARFGQNDYDVVHFAGHAWFDDLEPFIILSEQVKLHSSELRSMLSRHPPAILFLNSHFTSFVPPGASREEAKETVTEGRQPLLSGQRGFSEAASTAGVGTLIGSFYNALDDEPALQVGVNFHKELLKGTAVARALHQAMLLSTPTEETDNLTHQSYAMSGYGDIVLPLTESKKQSSKQSTTKSSKKSSKKASRK